MTTFNAGQVLTAAELNSAFGAKVDADAAAITGGYAEGLDHVYVTGTTNATSTGTGAVVVAGGVGIAMDVYVGGNTSLLGTASVGSTTDSASPTTGALVVAGGVGVAKSLQVGGSVSVGGSLGSSGQVQAKAATDATNTTTGALVVTGGVGVAKSLYVGTNANVGGNLVVGGNATITGQLSTSELIVLSGGSGIEFADGTTQTTAGEISGEFTSNSTGGTVTITAAETAVNTIFNFTGALTSNLVVQFPPAAKVCTIANNTTGSFTLTVEVVGETPSVVVGQGVATQVFTDASGAYQITAASIPLPLAVNQGGTGSTTPLAAAAALNVAALTGASFTGAVTVATSVGITDATNGVSQLKITNTGSNGAAILLAGNGSTTPNKYIRVINGAFTVVNNAGSANIIAVTDAGAMTLLARPSWAGYTPWDSNNLPYPATSTTANAVKFSWSTPTSGQVGLTIDSSYQGYLWHSGNFNPNNYLPNSGVPTLSGSLCATGYLFAGGADNPGAGQGSYIGWNESNGGGEMNLTCNQGAGTGGFVLRTVNQAKTVELGRVTISAAGQITAGSSIIANGNVYAGGTGGAQLQTNGNIVGSIWGGDLFDSKYIVHGNGDNTMEMWWGSNGSSNVIHFDVDGGEQATLIGVAVSDRNVKKNIKPVIRNSLGLIDSLRFVEFDYIESVSSGQHRPIGVIAQEAQETYQDSVFEIDGKMYMDERTMLYDALHAVKQLSAEVKALKAKLH